ncbi:MAG: hypothetical protein ACRCY8_01795 [Dermatophilaceae bacterium]
MSFSQMAEPTVDAMGSGQVDLDGHAARLAEVRAALAGVGFPADLDEVLAHLIRTRVPARVVARVAVLTPVVFADADEMCRSVALVDMPPP